MKLIRKFFIIFFSLSLLCNMTLNLYAKEDHVIKNDYVELTIDTDQAKYNSDEKITVTLTAKNISTTEINAVKIEDVLPENMTIVDDSQSQLSKDKLVPGETVVLKNVILQSSAIDTGDSTHVELYVALLVLSIVLALLTKRRMKKASIATICLLLTISGMTAVDASGKDKLKVQKTIKIDNNEVILKGMIQYDTVIENIDNSIILNINKDNLILSDGVYLLKDGTNAINGTVAPVSQLTSLKYYVSNEQKAIIDEGTLEIKENWTIPDIGLFMGMNTVTIIASSNNGMKKEKIKIYNDNPELVINTDIDTTTDSDSDGIADYIEEYFGSNAKEIDSDKDGLDDNIEQFIPGCDAAKQDSDNDGIIDGDEDYDEDGLSNAREVELGTDPAKKDSDGDGLTDFEEVKTYNTNPKNADSDGDGANDKWEIDHGYDPLVKNDAFSVSNESDFGDNQIKVNAHVSGEGVDTLNISKVSNIQLNNSIPGSMSDPVELTVDGKLLNAELSIEFDKAYLEQGAQPTIYYYNEATQELEPQKTTIKDNVASCQLSHFSIYILLDKKEFDAVWENEIKPPEYAGDDQKSGLDVVLAIDSSGSMYSNDINGLRKEAAKLFVDKLGDKDRAAIVDFDDSAIVNCPMTNNKDDLNSAIDKIDDFGGTNISNPISKGISLLTQDQESKNKFKFIILLTDGQGYYNNNYSTLAKENDIQIYTIGLGSGVDENLLKSIAEATDGAYYFAASSDELLGIYEMAAGETIDYVTDSNHDGISDYYTKLMCEGKIKLSTGAGIFEGISYEKVQANSDYDGDGLKNGEEVKVEKLSENRVAFKMASDPLESNVDLDNYIDRMDINMGNSPFQYNVFQSDVDNLGQTENMAPLFSRKFVNDGWYRAQLGIGNYIYGGEYDWTYVCEKELLEFITIYSQTMEHANTKTNQAETLLNSAKETLSSLQSLYETLKKFGDLGESKILTEINILIEEYYDYIELIHMSISKNSIDIDVLSAQYYQCTVKIEAIYEKVTGIIDLTKYPKLKNFFTNYKSIINKIPKSLDKISSAYEYVTIAIDTASALKTTSEAYSSLQANVDLFNDIKDMLTQIQLRTENAHMKKACDNVLAKVENSYKEFGTKIKDVMHNGLLDKGIDAILTKFGPVGWAISTGRALANLISNVGETTANHLRMIAIGDAIDCYAPCLIQMFMKTDADPYTNDRNKALQRMTLIGQLQIVGHNKVYSMSDSQGWIIKIFNKDKDVKNICKSSVDNLMNTKSRYHLKYVKNYDGASIK